MNKKQLDECKFIRSLSSGEAADWLMSKYSTLPYSLAHRSWKKVDQIRLAEYYIKGKLPFVSSNAYESFLSFMSVDWFIRIISENLPNSPDRIKLLLYYLVPALRKHQKNKKDEEIIDSFIAKLQEMLDFPSEG